MESMKGIFCWAMFENIGINIYCMHFFGFTHARRLEFRYQIFFLWSPVGTKGYHPKHVFISISGELYCFNLFQMSDFQTCGTVVMHVHLFGNWPQHDMICSSSNATWQCLVSNLYCSQGCIILAMIVTYSNRQQNFSLISPKKDSA